MKKQYKVTYEYRGKVTVDVEANNEEQADIIGMEEADQLIAGALTVYDSQVREVEP